MKKGKRDAVIAAILVTAIVIVINIICSENFIRADFTKGKIYTISDSTKDILSHLDEKIRLKFYVSEELPPKVLPIKRNVLDLLTEYERYGEGNLKLSVLYPEKDESIEKDALSAGIQKVQLNVIGQNKEELQAAYMGIVLYYQDKMETIPVVMSINDLEFRLTSLILKMTKEKKEKIVFLKPAYGLPEGLDPQMRAQLQAQMPQSHSIYQDTRAVGNALGEMYDVQEKKFEKGMLIDDDVTVLIINDAAKLSDWEKFAVDQYLMKGGKIIVTQAGMKINQQMFGQPAQFNFDDQFKNYGFSLEKNMVFDLHSYSVMVPQGNMRYLAPFPLWIKVAPEQLAEDLPDSYKDVGTLGFTFASSITVNGQDGVKYRPIVKTSGKSWAETTMVIADPTRINAPDESRMKVFDLAVLGEGKFKSAYTKDSIPEEIKALVGDPIEKAVKEGSVLMFGSADFILDKTIGNFRSNGLFFFNMIDYLTNSTELVGIRNRGSGFTFISPEITDGIKSVIKWVGTLLLPILIVIFGVARMILRNRRSGRA